MSKKVVAYLDVDNILSDFDEYFFEFAKKMGIPGAQNLPSGYIAKKMNFTEIEGMDFMTVFREFPHEWPQLLRTYEGAAEFTRSLKALGAHVILITSIPENKHKYRARRMVDDLVLFEALLCTFPGKKEDFIEASNAALGITSSDLVIFVDDMLKNCLPVQKAFPTAEVLTLNVGYNEEAAALNPKESAQITFVGKEGQTVEQMCQTLYAKVLKLVEEFLNEKVVSRRS